MSVNLEEAARSALTYTAHIKHTHEIIPDEVAHENGLNQLFFKYGAQKMIEYSTYGFRVSKYRSVVEQSWNELSQIDENLANIVNKYALVKLGVGLCGEMVYFTKFLLAKQKIHSVVVTMIDDNSKWNHSFLLIGSLESWKAYYQANNSKDPNVFFEKLPGTYIIDPFLRSFGPSEAFRTSHTALYLSRNKIKTFSCENSETMNPALLAEIENGGEQLLGLTRRNMNDSLDDSYSQLIHGILDRHFIRKWNRTKMGSFAVWTHGKEDELGVLKGKLAELGLPAKVEKSPGEGFSHSLVITTLPMR